MVNKYRNETSVELNGETYTLRPTFAALSEIEEKLNLSIFQFMTVVLAGQMKAKQAFIVLKAAIEASGEEVDDEELQQNMSEGGLDGTTIAISEFLKAAVSSGDNLKKK